MRILEGVPTKSYAFLGDLLTWVLRGVLKTLAAGLICRGVRAVVYFKFEGGHPCAAFFGVTVLYIHGISLCFANLHLLSNSIFSC